MDSKVERQVVEHQRKSFNKSLIFIIIGALMCVWSLVAMGYDMTDGEGDNSMFWSLGFLFSGFVFLAVGFFLNRAGKRLEG